MSPKSLLLKFKYRRLGRPWECVKVYGRVGNAEGHQSHFYRVNLHYRETAMYAAQELASSSVLHKPSCFSRTPF